MRFVTTVVFGLLLTAGIPSVRAESDVRTLNQRDAAQKIAQRVVQISGSGSPVFIREFRGLGESNVGLSKLVGEELIKLNIKVERGASVEVEGRITRLPTDDSLPLIGFTMNCAVVLPKGERKFSVDVLNRDEGHIASGKTGQTSPPPDLPPGESLKPGPVIDGTIIHAAAGSPYGVEILVERLAGAYDVLTPSVSGSSIRVKVRKGDILAIRLHNGSSFEAAASVLVDGLSRFDLADDPDRRGGLDLVAPGGQREIIGYFRNAEGVDAFLVGEYSKSPAAKLLPEPSAAGTFTIAFHAAWKPGDPPPPHEPPRTKSIGINQGPPRKDPTEVVKREIGGVRAIVKVFYGDE